VLVFSPNLPYSIVFEAVQKYTLRRRSQFGMSVRRHSPADWDTLYSYCPVAALNSTTSSAGTRLRCFTSMPCALAYSRTSVLRRLPTLCVRSGLAAGHRPLPVVPHVHTASAHPAAPGLARRSG
jgi:hypothetical protein